MAPFLGIDLSKETFHAFLLSDRADAKKVFPNTPKGFEQLTTWLKNRHADEVHICMEATGAYWEALALYLHGLEQHVSLVNPARIKAFAQSELLRTKTDAVDAALIARFCKSQSPEPWIPPALEIRVLQALMRHCDHLKKTRAQQSVYAQSSDSAVVTTSIREVIATLDEQIAQVERKIRQHFDDHPDLKRRRDLLTSIPGIGETTAGSILSEIPHLASGGTSKSHARGQFKTARLRLSDVLSRRLAMLSPSPFDCGRPGCARVGGSSCHESRSGANGASADRGRLLSAAGKHKRLINGAVMRKLLVLAYGILRSGVPFDANYA